MSIITLGIDLAKNVFAVHGVDDNGKAVLVKPKISRSSPAAADRATTAVPDRHGSVFRCALLGAPVPAA